MEIPCPNCTNLFDVVPRPDGWAGKFRLHVTCPHCLRQFRWKFLPQGPKRDQDPVEVLRIDTQNPVMIQEYDGTVENARRFGEIARFAWDKVPLNARDSIVHHWKQQPGAPFVWLLEDRTEWRGAGWAATAQGGMSLFVVDRVVAALPDEHLESLLIHEFGHFLFIAEGEKHHCKNTGDDRLLRCEKLVWDLTASWGVDITDAEFWMMRHFIDNKNELRFRETPLPVDEARREFNVTRAPIVKKMASFDFPPKFFKFRDA